MEKTISKKFLTTKDLTYIPIFTALTAVLSQIIIPLPFTPISISLATLSVYLAGGLLGTKNGTLSQAIYVLIGAVGIPVFAGLTGGFGIIAGPTGGYLAGYIVAAFVIGQMKKFLPKSIWSIITAMILGTICCYLLGTIWFMFVTKTGLLASLTMCVIPFLPGDALKIILASYLVKRLESSIS